MDQASARMSNKNAQTERTATMLFFPYEGTASYTERSSWARRSRPHPFAKPEVHAKLLSACLKYPRFTHNRLDADPSGSVSRLGAL